MRCCAGCSFKMLVLGRCRVSINTEDAADAKLCTFGCHNLGMTDAILQDNRIISIATHQSRFNMAKIAI